MKFNFIRQLALTLGAVGLAASVVVGTWASAGDNVPVVSETEMPFDPFVKPAVSRPNTTAKTNTKSNTETKSKPKAEVETDALSSLPQVVVTRLPKVSPAKAVEAEPSSPTGPKTPSTVATASLPTAGTPARSGEASTRRAEEPAGQSSSGNRSVNASKPEAKAVVVPATPVLPKSGETSSNDAAITARPAMMTEAIRKPGSRLAVVKIPTAQKSESNPEVEQAAATDASTDLRSETTSSKIAPPKASVKRIKKLPLVVRPPAARRNNDARTPSVILSPQSSVAQVIVAPQTATPVIEPYLIGKVNVADAEGDQADTVGKSDSTAGVGQASSVAASSKSTPASNPREQAKAATSGLEMNTPSANIALQGDSSRRGAGGLMGRGSASRQSPEALVGLKSSVLDDSALPLSDRSSLGLIPPLNPTGDIVRHSTVIEDGEVILDGALEPVAEEMPILNECCRGCPQRTYVVAEGLLFRREGEQTQLTSGFKLDGFGFKEGMRFTLGRRNDCLTGWEATYTGVEPWYTYDSASSPGGDLQAAFQPGRGFTHANLDTFYNATYQEQMYRSELHNIELNRMNWGWDVLSHSLGLRYMILNEDMRFTSLKGSDRADLEIETNNHLIGPQIGSELFYDVGGRFYFSSRYRLGAFANVNDGAVQYTSEEFPLSSFVNTDQNVGFSFLGDLQVNAFYKLGPRARLRAGYELWYAWGLSTAKGNLGPGVGPSMGANMNDTSDVLFNGLSVGFEYVR